MFSSPSFGKLKTLELSVLVQEVAYFYQCKDGVDYLFVDHPSYHRPGVQH